MRLLLLLALLWPLAGCVTNPVTGQRDFILYGDAWDRATGTEQYGPAQQSQGGEYVMDPVLTRYVAGVGQRVAAHSDNKLPYEFVILNSSVPNAWALPGGKIAINRGLLLELDNEAELAAVLGHEVVHAAARHGARQATRRLALEGALAVTALASEHSEYADAIVGGAILGGQLLNTRYGRDAERESDSYGIRYMLAAGYDPRAAISLQETFVRLSEGRPQNWLSGLFASHPPSEERVANNRALVQTLSPGHGDTRLELGTERYRRATARLREKAPAYALFDDAVAAADNGDYARALNLVERALAIEPGEARFHGLRGDIHRRRGAYASAVDAYDAAIGLHEDYFHYHAGRGMALARQGHGSLARRDLETSVRLLPTAAAANELGKLYYADRDFTLAKQYFQLAARGQGEAATEARAYYARIDVQDNPDRYLDTDLWVNGDRELLITVTNPLDVRLEHVQLRVRVEVDGAATGFSHVIPALDPATSLTVATGMKLPRDFARERDSVSLGVSSARLALAVTAPAFGPPPG